jgi:mono/diheme cytochrome c family protein
MNEISTVHYKWFCIIGLALIISSGVLLYKESMPEWKIYQKVCKRIQLTRLQEEIDKWYTDVSNPAAEDNLKRLRLIKAQLEQRETKIQQVVLDSLNRIDRCTSCHIGMEDKSLQYLKVPLKTHSGQYLAWHPIEKYGCTTCHEGQGLATNYEDAAHNQISHWEKTMIPAGLTQISCGKCHLGKNVPYASLLSDGRQLLERYGCYGCHEVQRYSEELKPSLSLDRLGDKVNKEWLIKWLMNPADYLKEAKMPGFNLSQDEIIALTEFLLSSKDKESSNILEGNGDYERGGKLFRESRCISCHSINGKGGVLASELGNIASKVKKEWLFLYLRDVHYYQPRIKMLQYNFTEQDALDIAEYMMEEFYSEEDIKDDEDKNIESESMDTNVSESDSKELIRNGKKIFIKYGCYGCHDRTGIDIQLKIGPELKEIGSKDEEHLGFGNVRDIKKSIMNYIFMKIKDPRLFDNNAKMPHYNLSDEELIKLTVALLSFTKEEIPISYTMFEERKTKFNPQGQFGFLFGKFRCISCHEVFGSGGELSTAPLDMTGSQLKKEWLLKYLKKPYAVRPIVTERMPRFKMTDDEAMYMADYIKSVFVDDSIPEDFEGHFQAGDIKRGKELFEEKGCISCHILGKGGGYIGPELNDVGNRLKSGWIFKWLLNPQLYKPDTIEPDYGFSEDEARALSAYLSSMK